MKGSEPRLSIAQRAVRIAEECGEDLLAEVFRDLPGWRPAPGLPEAVDVVVALVHEEREPRDFILDDDESQRWVPIEHTGEEQVDQ